MEDVPVEIFNTTDIETEVYCVCKSEDSLNLIECEGPNCKTKFYHMLCVGLKVQIDDGPSDWMCYACLGQNKPQSFPVPAKKGSSKSRTTKPKYTVKEYDTTLEKAKDDAKCIVNNTLLQLNAEPFCRLNENFQNILSTTLEKLHESNTAVFDCQQLIEHIWPSVTEADNRKQLISTRLDKKAVSFHSIRGSEVVKLTFKNFLTNLGITNYSSHLCAILSQFLFQRLFQELSKKRNPVQLSTAQSHLFMKFPQQKSRHCVLQLVTFVGNLPDIMPNTKKILCHKFVGRLYKISKYLNVKWTLKTYWHTLKNG